MFRELTNGKMSVYCMEFPYRKKLGLGIKIGTNEIVKCATFNDEKAAEIFMNYLAMLVGARREEDHDL